MARRLVAMQPARMSAVPQAVAPTTTPYDILGKDAPLRRLVDAFYDRMDALPAAHPLRTMHAEDLAPMREKLFDFLSGWLGGPDRYFARPDAKCMGSAHTPFDISEGTAGAWLECMQQAMEDIDAPVDFRTLVMPAFTRMAKAMIRR